MPNWIVIKVWNVEAEKAIDALEVSKKQECDRIRVERERSSTMIDIVKILNPKSGRWTIILDGAKVLSEEDEEFKALGISIDDVPIAEEVNAKRKSGR